jgi:hypothetical protein
MSRKAGPVQPPVYSDDAIKRECRRSLDLFVEEWTKSAPARKKEFWRLHSECERAIDTLLSATKDLSAMRAEALVGQRELVDAVRFVGAPFISEDDLVTLAGLGGAGARTEAEGRRVLEVARVALDPLRFPWVEAGRQPTSQERSQAIAATAAVWATERFRTARRNKSSAAQEAAVGAALRDCGLKEQGTFQNASRIAPGAFFNGGAMVAGTRCDRIARLNDSRLLAIECKTSNSAVNSFKRLNNDTVAKAEKWRTEFGNQLVTIAVLAGVFRPENVLDAQNKHRIFIVWAHDLEPLKKFTKEATVGH